MSQTIEITQAEAERIALERVRSDQLTPENWCARSSAFAAIVYGFARPDFSP